MGIARMRVIGGALLGLFVLAATLSGERSAWAGGDPPMSAADMVRQMQIMQTRMQALEQKVDSQELRSAEKDSEIRALKKQIEQNQQDLTSLPAYDFLRNVNVNGYVSGTFTDTFNGPSDRLNRLRTFDINSHTFSAEAFQLELLKESTEASRAGFLVDLFMGRDARLLGAATADTPDGTNGLDDIELMQAYVSYLADIGKGVNFKVGKFATLLGAEVLDRRYNYNISRSILFGYAIPFTHTGVRATYAFNDKWNATFGVNNGWDTNDAVSNGFSYEGQIGWVPSDKFSFYASTIWGPAEYHREHNKRGVIDLVATWKPTKKWTFIGNFDWGQQRSVPFDLNGDGIPDVRRTATWTGEALVVNYDFTDRFGVAARGEYFEDPQGFRTGYPQNAWEYTVTPHYQLTPKLLARLELRSDYSDRKYFLVGMTPAKHQESILGEMLYSF